LLSHTAPHPMTPQRMGRPSSASCARKGAVSACPAATGTRARAAHVKQGAVVRLLQHKVLLAERWRRRRRRGGSGSGGGRAIGVRLCLLRGLRGLRGRGGGGGRGRGRGRGRLVGLRWRGVAKEPRGVDAARGERGVEVREVIPPKVRLRAPSQRAAATASRGRLASDTRRGTSLGNHCATWRSKRSAPSARASARQRRGAARRGAAVLWRAHQSLAAAAPPRRRRGAARRRPARAR
jgi:hypothetical protein